MIQRRLGEAREEMSHYPEYDYIVVNDLFDQALGELRAIITAQRLRQRSRRNGCRSGCVHCWSEQLLQRNWQGDLK